MILTITLSSIAVLLLAANFILVWYCRKILSYFRATSNEFDRLLVIVTEYQEHLSKVYNMETFYGDSTLKSLLDHTNKVSSQIETFVSDNEDVFSDE
jgi:hypothetical protein